MRLAGTWKVYSKKAIPQLISVTFHSGTFWYLRWPYQAKVIKMLEIKRKIIVSMRGPLAHSQVRRRFQRSAANAADHGRAVSAGERIGDLASAVRTIKCVRCLLRIFRYSHLAIRLSQSNISM